MQSVPIESADDAPECVMCGRPPVEGDRLVECTACYIAVCGDCSSAPPEPGDTGFAIGRFCHCCTGQRDTASSASRQHWIDTGEFLNLGTAVPA